MAAPDEWLFWALLSALFAALTAILAKAGLGGVDPDLATLVRTFVILLVLSGFVWMTGKWSSPLAMPARTWRYLVLSGLATGASWVCYFRALKSGDVSLVAPVEKLSLVAAALLAFVFLGERPNAWQWLGILMMAAGAAMVGLRR